MCERTFALVFGSGSGGSTLGTIASVPAIIALIVAATVVTTAGAVELVALRRQRR